MSYVPYVIRRFEYFEPLMDVLARDIQFWIFSHIRRDVPTLREYVQDDAIRVIEVWFGHYSRHSTPIRIHG